MDHNEAFLQDICATPDDDGPRLIYADWLEEHGDPDRAAFIRTQVALARADPADDRCAGWEQTAADLLDAHRDEWLGPLRWCTSGPVFRRGFLEAITMSAFNFLAQAPFMFPETPLREVCFSSVNTPLGELLDCPYLPRLSGLGFRRDSFYGVPRGVEGVSPATVADVLAGSPRFAGLTSLDLGVGDEDLRVLAAAGHLRRLAAFELRGSSVGDEGVRALVDSPNLPPPRELGLAATRVSAEGVAVLVSSPRADQLRSLDLLDAPIGREGLMALATSSHLGELTRLGVGYDESNEALTEDDLRLLIDSPLVDRLQSLKLGVWYEHYPAAVGMLARSPRLRSLTALELVGGVFNEECTRLLAGSPSLTRLRRLRVHATPEDEHAAIRKVLHDRWGSRLLVSEE